MPTVFDNAMTAHVWAQGRQPEGRSHNGNFYFEGRALYSYGRHFVAGFLLSPGRGLVNDTRYSVSTGRHLDYARRALSLSCHVPDLTELARIMGGALELADGRTARGDSAGAAEALKAARGAVMRWAEGEAFPAEAARVHGRLSRGGRPDFPLIQTRALVWIFGALGMAEAEAEKAAAKALKARARNESAWEAAEAQHESRALLTAARALAARPLSDLAEALKAQTRDTYFDAKRHGDSWLGEARRHFRAAKAAKARGWARVAADVKARESMIRAAVKTWPEIEGVSHVRGAIRAGLESIRTAKRIAAELAAATAETWAELDSIWNGSRNRADTLRRGLGAAEGLGLIPAGPTPSPDAWRYQEARADLGRIMRATGLLTPEAGAAWAAWAADLGALVARLDRRAGLCLWRAKVADMRKARAAQPHDLPALTAGRDAAAWVAQNFGKAGNPFRAAGWTRDMAEAEAQRHRTAAAAAAAAAKAAEEAALSAYLTAARDAWRNGLPLPEKPAHVGRFGALDDGEGGAMIRAELVERDESGAIVGGQLRTSQGATVPLTHAVRAFRFLKLCRDTGKEWRANGKTLPVGHFRVDMVDASGGFRAGCHRINWPEVERVARGLGLADMAPADTTESRGHVPA